MEQYLWMAIGCVIVGFFVNTYWDVYKAYRAYQESAPSVSPDQLVRGPHSEPDVAAPSTLAWLLDKGDRFLHAMLMSPISR